jgi:hypothetical protein
MILALKYLALVVFSKYSALAAVLFLFALIGTVDLFREDAAIAILFLSFPVLYFLYMASQNVMIVRNYLVIVPFLAVLASRGCVAVRGRLRWRALRIALVSAISAVALVNLLWLGKAAFTVRGRTRIDRVAQLSAYLDDHPRETFFLSDSVATDLAARLKTPRPNVTSVLPAATSAVFYASEVQKRDWKLWTANRFDYVRTWFGPYEVNFNYYPSWSGDDRIVVMSAQSALPLGLR